MAITYKVYYATSAKGPWTLADSGVSTTTDTINNLQPSTNYYFQVVATDSVTGLSNSQIAGPFTTQTSVEASPGTFVTAAGQPINASPTPGSAGVGNYITITSGAQIACNGTTIGGANVKELYYINHTCYQQNTANNWYGPITSTSVGSAVSDPRPAITDITLSNSSIPYGSPSGTTVGTLSVSFNAGTFSGTLAIASGTSAGLSISGTSVVTTTALASGTYSLYVTATQSGTVSGVAVSPYTTPTAITITVQAATTLPSRPPAIPSTWGIVWSDDFTTNTIGSSSATSGYNWYLIPGRSTSDYSLHTTATASQIANGNSGGGTNASPNGGVLTIVNGTSSNGTMQSCPQTLTGTAGQQGNSWKHGYFEAYIQFKNVTQNPGWPAFWSWQTGPQTNATVTELDFLEIIGGNVICLTFHSWYNNYATDTQTGPLYQVALTSFDSNWHTYGCYWSDNGDGTGTVQMYIDNVAKGAPVTTGPNTKIPVFENGYQYLILGTSSGGWQMNVDWVRVWQAPTGPVAPQPAVNAGMTTLAFNDDFTNASSVTGTSSGDFVTGVNWYASRYDQPSPTYFQVYPTTTAAQLSNGNTSGGTNASPSGGIFRCNGISNITNWGNFQTIPQRYAETGYSGKGSWKHMYAEAYIQYDATGQATQAGCPAFWMLSTASPGTEIDFLEILTDQSGTGTRTYLGTIHNWPNGFGNTDDNQGQLSPITAKSSEWHTYGILWQQTGTGTGQLTYYFDNQQSGSPRATGTGSTIGMLENDYMYLIIGTSPGWPVYVDWVRVWTS